MALRQAKPAIVTADLVLFLVDRDRSHRARHRRARTLRRASRPVVLGVTKVDDERGESDAAESWSLGLSATVPVQRAARPWLATYSTPSWASCRGAAGRRPAAAPPVALVGRPNVGGSSCSTAAQRAGAWWWTR